LWLRWECITVSSKYLFSAGRVIHKHITVKNKTDHFEKYVQVLVDDLKGAVGVIHHQPICPGTGGRYTANGHNLCFP
jgi:hypothetical protein